MPTIDLNEIYIEQINSYHLPEINCLELERACNSDDDSYAKVVLKGLHDAFVDVYGTATLDDSHEFVLLPAVIKGTNTGHMGIGFVELDLQSSGEHWGTYFLSPIGLLQQGGTNLKPVQAQYISEHYIPYEYWYTVDIPHDIHVNQNTPDKVAELLSACVPESPEMKMY